MHVRTKNTKREKSADVCFTLWQLTFVVIELIYGNCNQFPGCLLDAVYDGVEFVMLLPSLFLIPFLYRPAM